MPSLASVIAMRRSVYMSVPFTSALHHIFGSSSTAFGVLGQLCVYICKFIQHSLGVPIVHSFRAEARFPGALAPEFWTANSFVDHLCPPLAHA